MDDIEKDYLLHEIGCRTLLSGGLIKNIGLFNGKMGLSIFMYKYSKVKSIDIYERYADELLNDIIESIDNQMEYGLSNGLCGIAWGIEYLIRNQYVEGDSIEILYEINKKICEQDITLLYDDMSLSTGMIGILHYYAYHFLSNEMYIDKISLNLIDRVDKLLTRIVYSDDKMNILDIDRHLLFDKPWASCQYNPDLLLTTISQYDNMSTINIDLIDKCNKNFDFGIVSGLSAMGLRLLDN